MLFALTIVTAAVQIAYKLLCGTIGYLYGNHKFDYI